jgi:hypothetical protein
LRADAGATTSSQNAAALLIDLETIDIRRVGTDRGEYSKSGVFRVKQLAICVFNHATMSHAQV